jgi:hypothetical protein
LVSLSPASGFHVTIVLQAGVSSAQRGLKGLSTTATIVGADIVVTGGFEPLRGAEWERQEK